MKKQDLKTGDIVECRNGATRMVLLDTNKGDLMLGKSWDHLNYYNDNLTSIIYRALDICKVYRPDSGYECKLEYWVDGNIKAPLIWEREHGIEIKITVTKNGKEIDPSEISKKTWNNLRKKS